MRSGDGQVLLILAAGLIACFAAPARGQVRERAIAADDGVDIVGVNTHLYYPGVYVDGFDQIILPRLVELGVRHIRDNMATGNPTYCERLKALAAAGIRATLINDTRYGLARLLQDSHDAIRALNAGNAQVVEAVEPPNEMDFGDGWEQRLLGAMRELHRLYKDDHDLATASLPLLGPSFADTRDSPPRFAAACPEAAALMDTANLHCYSGGNPVEGSLGGGWGISLDDAIGRYRKLSDGRPLIATETGYHNAVGGGVPGFPGVSEKAAAAYMPRLFLTYLQKGFTRAFLYEFIDEGVKPNDHEQHFGLLHHDGTPKAQYLAIRNYIRVLRDPGPRFTPGALDYRLSEDAAGLGHLLLQKRDGRFYLALWQPVVSFDTEQKRDTVTTPKPVLVHLGAVAQRVRVFDPVASAEPETTSGGVDSVKVKVGDTVLLVEVTPAS